MKIQLTTVLFIIFGGIFFHSCNYDKTEFEKEVFTETPIEQINSFDGASEFVISQNYLTRVMAFSLISALAHPEMRGLQGSAQVETRNCPTITMTTGSPNVLEIDFGTDCDFQNTIGGTADVISGVLRMEAFGSITDQSTNTFLFFDELKINDRRIRFVTGNPMAADWVKFKFSGNTTESNFRFDAFIDGTLPDSIPFDPFLRSQFQFINDSSGDSLVLYPSYSGITAFNFDFINPDDPTAPPEFTYASLVNGLYEVDINPIVAFYFDDAGTLEEDYNIRKGDDPLLFTPLCKWIYGGDLIYENISNNPNYTDTQPDVYKEIFYGSDEEGEINDVCDRFVKIRSCDGFLNGACVNEQIEIISCPE